MINNFFKHPSAIIETESIGEGSRIWAFVHILKGVIIGKNANVCDHCFIENGVLIGDDVTIKCGVYLWDGVVAKDNVFIGPNVSFTNDLYPRSKNANFKKLLTLLDKGCSIGANSTILAGIKIGMFAMVGAGSVVTKDVGDYELVYGNPAKHEGFICKCGSKLSFKNDLCECGCGLRYSSNGLDKVIEVLI